MARTKIIYSRTFNLGNAGTETIGLEITVDENATPAQIQRLNSYALNQVQEAYFRNRRIVQLKERLNIYGGLDVAGTMAIEINENRADLERALRALQRGEPLDEIEEETFITEQCRLLDENAKEYNKDQGGL